MGKPGKPMISVGSFRTVFSDPSSLSEPTNMAISWFKTIVYCCIFGVIRNDGPSTIFIFESMKL